MLVGIGAIVSLLGAMLFVLALAFIVVAPEQRPKVTAAASMVGLLTVAVGCAVVATAAVAALTTAVVNLWQGQ